MLISAMEMHLKGIASPVDLKPLVEEGAHGTQTARALMLICTNRSGHHNILLKQFGCVNVRLFPKRS